MLYSSAFSLNRLFSLQLRISEMEMNKARNLIEHEEEIFSRPPRVWFQSKADLKRKSGENFEGNCEILFPVQPYPLSV